MPADDDIFGEADDDMGDQLASMTDEELVQRARLLDNEIKVMRSESTRLGHDHLSMKERIKENNDKIKLNRTLPYLVANIVEILDVDPEEDEETIFLPVIGLVAASELKPADLVGVNKDSYLILDALPCEYDSRVKVQELVEAIVLPFTHKEKFVSLGIKPPKGVLMFGPPGVGKTLMARACAAQTNACFLKLAGPALVQMFIGDGAKLTYCILAISDTFFLDGATIIAATNRVDILDPALLRSGRIDRKIEVRPLTNSELARCTDDFNGAQLKAVCVEAGMLALRRDGTEIGHEDFMEGISQVQSKKKADLSYYA
ncbi:P-loop containing nucleoside triphosphate hydrolase protein [Pavlovales sp. CCMP2436]|nr:P-loop containing nucleoside triphosphate hydrolase protein [Pavlovales sp. CCMP2436]